MKRTLTILAILLSAMSSRAAQPSLFEALNTTNLTWGICCVSVWLGQTEVSHDGIAAAKSWPISDNQEVYLYTTLTGPGTVAFWWKVSSELDCDFLEFSIGGIPQSNISGEQDWQRLAFRVPAGSQELRWTYRKDAYASWTRDCGWVDEVAFVPDSGPPVILAQPATQTGVVGVPVTFVVAAGGCQPCSYQWYFQETNAIEGATSATLTLPNMQLANAGRYSVVVTNSAGCVTSSPAALWVTTNQILFFADSPYGSPFYLGLQYSGRPYQRFTANASFNAALSSANPATTLAVVDSIYDPIDTSALVNFVNAGGRAILQYWNLSAEAGLAAAFEATVVQNITTPLPVYDWGGTTLFAGLASPLNLVETLWTLDGQKLQPTAGGQAVAGYTSAATPNQAALVTGNSGRTLLNGFIVEDFSALNDAVRFVQNEIDCLLGVIESARIPFANMSEVSASSEYDFGYEVVNLFNGYGLSADGNTHGDSVGFWSSDGWGPPNGEWVKVRFDKSYPLDYLRIWNCNETGCEAEGIQFADVYVIDSDVDPGNNTHLNWLPFNATGWKLVLPNQTFVRAPVGPASNTDPHISLGGVTARQLAFKINANFSTPDDPWVGLSEVQIYRMPPTPPPIPELPGRAITTPGGVPTFKFTPPAGFKYRMVWKNELTDDSWTPLGDWSPTSTGAEMTLTDTIAGGQPHRFYRLEAANP
jgi:hypothetical protein